MDTIMGPFYGVRAWHVNPVAVAPLRSVASGIAWHAGWNESHCGARSGHFDHHCGFWSWKSFVRAESGHFLSGYDAGAIGLIEYKGWVVEHEDGYRGEHARILALSTVTRYVSNENDCLAQWADKYEIPLFLPVKRIFSSRFSPLREYYLSLLT